MKNRSYFVANFTATQLIVMLANSVDRATRCVDLRSYMIENYLQQEIGAAIDLKQPKQEASHV